MIDKKNGDKIKIVIPEVDLPSKSLTFKEIELDEKKDLNFIQNEFKRGFDFIKKYDKSVSFFGSSRFDQSDEHSKEAYLLAKEIVEKLGYAIVTGGGPGIMQAANHGAYDAKGNSLGLTIKLPKEQASNIYTSDQVGFHYFFTRKTIMTFAAEAYVFFPGGFGTLDEFFGILTLVQTNKIPQVPIILIGSDFWEPMDEFIKKTMIDSHKSIDPTDIKLYKIIDNHDEIIEIIRKAPILNWWKNFEL